jgi:endogenous inhibitor of DNA gyrase (YacG/DUF329 family)
MRADERITVECPRCGAVYAVWPQSAPVLALDPELGDPGYLESAAETTCPECGKTSCCGGLLHGER